MSNPRPGLGFHCSKGILPYILSTCSYYSLIILNSTFLLQVVLSATLSRLLPLQLRFERFRHQF